MRKLRFRPVTSLRPHRRWGVEPEFNPSPSGPKLHAPWTTPASHLAIKAFSGPLCSRFSLPDMPSPSLPAGSVTTCLPPPSPLLFREPFLSPQLESTPTFWTRQLTPQSRVLQPQPQWHWGWVTQCWGSCPMCRLGYWAASLAFTSRCWMSSRWKRKVAFGITSVPWRVKSPPAESHCPHLQTRHVLSWTIKYLSLSLSHQQNKGSNSRANSGWAGNPGGVVTPQSRG